MDPDRRDAGTGQERGVDGAVSRHRLRAASQAISVTSVEIVDSLTLTLAARRQRS